MKRRRQGRKRGKRNTGETEKLKNSVKRRGKTRTFETDEEKRKKIVRLFCFPSLPFQATLLLSKILRADCKTRINWQAKSPETIANQSLRALL